MKYIVLDLEATCWEDRGSQKTSEIIEIGAICMNQEGRIVNEFSEFIRPRINPVLSAFCRQLTSISQENVDNADLFPEVIQRFKSWLDTTEDFVLCSWGFYDKKQLISDCNLHGTGTSWLLNHISLKHQYAEIKKLSRPVGMSAALHMEKFPLEGIHHRGIDDARNITKIFLKHFQSWKF